MKWSVCLISCQTARLPIISWPSFSSMGGIRYTQDLKSISSRIWMYFSRSWFKMVILNLTFVALSIIYNHSIQYNAFFQISDPLLGMAKLFTFQLLY